MKRGSRNGSGANGEKETVVERKGGHDEILA